MTGFSATVVIPLYNKQAFIRRTLQSALAQSHPAAAIIIVDDQSTDGSVAAIADLIGDSPRGDTPLGENVRLVRQANAGPGPARNRGIVEATSEWIAFLDADDVWQPNHLATLAEVAAACPEADVVAARHRRIAASEPLPAIEPSPTAARTVDFFREAQAGEVMQTSAVAVRRAVLAASGGFDAFYPGEDFELWTRLALDHSIAVSSRETVIYLQQTGGLMEQHEARKLAPFALGNLYALLNATLEDQRHEKIYDIHVFKNVLLKQNIRQMLYRGESEAARSYIVELDRFGRIDIPFLRTLSTFPSFVLKLGMRLRSWKRFL